jgi:hypothetical protein
MKIATLGSPDAISLGAGVENIPLLSAKHVGDVDVFVLEHDAVTAEFVKDKTKEIGEQYLIGYTLAFSEKMSVVKRVSESGSPVLVFLSSVPSQVKFNRGNYISYSDRWSEFWPLTEVEMEASVGTSLRLADGISAPELLEFETKNLPYQVSIVPKIEGFPLFVVPSKVPGDVKHAGYVIPNGKSFVAFLPRKLCSNLEFEYQIQKIVTGIKFELTKQQLNITRPGWLMGLQDETDAPVSTNIQSNTKEIVRLQLSVALDRAKLAETEWKYGLLFETGNTLDACVLKALNALGLKSFPGPHPRADFVGRLGNNVVFGEVKGVDGAAQELALIQLAKWEAEIKEALYHSNETDDPIAKEYHKILYDLGCFDDGGKPIPELQLKGIAVINAFRHVPIEGRPQLSNRKNQIFPEVFEQKLKKENRIAMQSLQLLAMMNDTEVQTQPEEIWSNILSTNGIYLGHSDTSSLLTKVDAEPQQAEPQPATE